MKYKVNFSGYAYVEADSEEEAKEKFNDDEYVYKEQVIDGAEVVEAFEIVV